jgi:outer membrane protein assembly factor BamB
MNPSKPSAFKIRWKSGAILLGVLALLDFVVYFALNDNRTFQIMAMWGLGMLTLIVTLLWWILGSGASWGLKAKGIVIFGVVAGAFSLSLRVDGFKGDMFPILAFRWTATPEEKAADYRENQLVQGQEASGLDFQEIGQMDWPDFRGQDRTGIIPGRLLNPDPDWQSSPPELLWKIPVGLGWGSVSVVGSGLFTMEQRGPKETLAAYSLVDGSEIWSVSHGARFSEQMGGDGPRTTPVYHEGKVYAFGATGWLSAHEAGTGKTIWAKNILEENQASNLVWGMSSTPVIYKDMIIAAPGGPAGSQVQAYRLDDGEVVWKSGSGGASYGSPVIRELGGRDWALVFQADGLYAMNPEDGAVGWSFAWSNSPKVNAAIPYVNGNEVLISNGYGVGSALFEVTSESIDNEETWKTSEIWTSIRLKSKFNDLLIHEGFIYGLDEGRLTCLDLESGRRLWKGDSYGFGQMLQINNRIIILSESGEVALVKMDSEDFQEITKFQAIQGKTWNHPAIAHGKLIVRNDREMACFDLDLEYDEVKEIPAELLGFNP